MQTTLNKWGNSLAVRIPKNLADELNLHEGSSLDLHAENDRIIIEKCENKQKLLAMLAKVTKDNIHEETQTGGPVGNEFW